MKKMILIIFILVGWLGNYIYYTESNVFNTVLSSNEQISNDNLFECDGRTYCSEMTSCEEAKFFLNNCPDTKMDGNNDGIPCERQWCN
ncbi:excalibur calcium-binding domain-containing protein [Campylobacterota bacterium DY0563]